MKRGVGLIVAVFCLLVVLTTLVPYPPARLEAAQFFSAEDIDRGQQHALQRRLLFWASTAGELAVLLAFGATDLGRRLADRLLQLTRGRPLLAVLGVGLVVFLLAALAQLPTSIGSYWLSISWGMTTRAFLPWFGEYLLGGALELALGAIVVTGLYVLLRFTPRVWWALAAFGSGALAVALTFLAPVVISPLFNTFTPLAETEWKAQDGPVRRLAAEAGAPVQDILVVDASRQGQHTNAYFTGFGSTRRIVLYDTLLKKHTPAEVESIVGHELGHWIHHHIALGILLALPAVLLGLFVLDRILRRAQGRGPWRLQGLADPAGLPLILLLSFLAAWLVRPLETAVSRHFERQADAAALRLAGRPDDFVKAEKKLAVDNLSNVAPTPWNVWLFSTHPSAVERIETGLAWKSTHP